MSEQQKFIEAVSRLEHSNLTQAQRDDLTQVLRFASKQIVQARIALENANDCTERVIDCYHTEKLLNAVTSPTQH